MEKNIKNRSAATVNQPNINTIYEKDDVLQRNQHNIKTRLKIIGMSVFYKKSISQKIKKSKVKEQQVKGVQRPF